MSSDGDEMTALVLDDGSEMTLDYKMHHLSDRWLVFDINVLKVEKQGTKPIQ